MADVQLVAIVNSFNRLSLLQQGLPSLVKALEACSITSAIMVFDAGSTDGSREWTQQFARDNTHIPIHQLYPGTQGDSSFSAGVNEASKQAGILFPQLQWLFLYETDNWLADGSPITAGLQVLAKEERLAGIGFTVKNHAGQPVGFGSSFPTVWQFVIGPHLTFHLGADRPALLPGGTINQQHWYLCDVVYTSPLIVNYQAWQQSGGMNAKLFPFSDCDLDWSWRLHELGWKMAVLETDLVVHDNRQQLSLWSATRVWHLHRARLRLLVLHVGPWVACLKPLFFIRHLLELTVLCLSAAFREHPRESISKRWLLLKSVWRNYE